MCISGPNCIGGARCAGCTRAPGEKRRVQALMRGQRGLGFIELILFMVIVGVALLAILNVMNLTTRNSADPLLRKQALMIAEGLMEEVQLARYTYCDGSDPAVTTATSAADCSIPETVGPSPGETRPYNHINDYVTQFGQPQRAFDVNGVLSDVAGMPLPEGYVATLTLTPETLGGVASDGTPGGNEVLRVTVSVSAVAVANGAGGDTVVLDGYRMRYAPNAP